MNHKKCQLKSKRCQTSLTLNIKNLHHNASAPKTALPARRHSLILQISIVPILQKQIRDGGDFPNL